MSQAHLHLLITHLPIVGSILGTLVLIYGLLSKSNETKLAGYYVLIISSLGSVLAYLTGEAAEESVENIQGVAEGAIEQHEDFAVIGFIALIVLGCFALLATFLTIKKSAWVNKAAIFTLFTGFISFGLIAWTGYLGGQIRHTEVSTSANQAPIQQEKVQQEKEDDD
jgi:uncharacterized membrane protein